MSFNQISARFKQSAEAVGYVTPNVMYSEPQRPHGDYQVASWLPVGRYEGFYDDYFTVSTGKVVAFDRQGRVVPAGLKKAFTTGGAGLSYTAADAAVGVVNLVTGSYVTGAVTYTPANVTTGLVARGLIDTTETADAFISWPVGVAPMNYWKNAGGDGNTPALDYFYNYNLQHRVAILCKYVMQLPHVPAIATAMDLSSNPNVGAKLATAISAWVSTDADGNWYSSTAMGLTTRYANMGIVAATDVAVLVLPTMSLATNTVRTPFTLPTGFTRQRSSISEISVAGDYWVDYEVGAFVVFSDTGATGLPPVVTGTLQFYSYDAAPGTVSTYACVVDNVALGDYLTCDENSNFIKARNFVGTDAEFASMGTGVADDDELAAMSQAVADRQDGIIAQVIGFDQHPKDYVERVRTMFPSFGVMDQMPGSATGGMPLQITYASASDMLVQVLLLK